MVQFWLAFVPLFVAVDAIGVLPLFLSLTAGLDRRKIRRIIWQSVFTATVVALCFLAVGKFIFALLHITVADFMIAGGALLFAISVNDLVSVETELRPVDLDSLGVVPLGVPLIVGPAVLTTLLLLIDERGWVPTVSAMIANILFAGLLFWLAEPIHRALGRTGAKAVSKIASLILAAIAVMMMRRGIMSVITG